DIRISTYVSSEMLVCCFEDYGNGVQPEDIPFLFDKFFRGKNAKESGQAGSGLGLYTSRYILEKTGGQIKAYNFNQDGQSGFAVEISLKILF
ncbi:MAG: ATP-binding protein, partial [Bacillota bacterium]|nr:ATP-binding protein [Bacillota bacterium]